VMIASTKASEGKKVAGVSSTAFLKISGIHR
jgi:hypothetical protein